MSLGMQIISDWTNLRSFHRPNLQIWRNIKGNSGRGNDGLYSEFYICHLTGFLYLDISQTRWNIYLNDTPCIIAKGGKDWCNILNFT